MHHSDAKYRTIMCRIQHSIFLLCLAYTTFSICKCLSAIFRCYFCFSFSESLSISAEKHKNSSHEPFTDFYQSKCPHCPYLFLLFCFRKAFLTVSLFFYYCYFILSQISNRSCNKFSSFISLRCWYQINPGSPTAKKNEAHKIFIACPLLLIPPYPNPHTRFTNKT